jgi:hypothetical protein
MSIIDILLASCQAVLYCVTTLPLEPKMISAWTAVAYKKGKMISPWIAAVAFKNAQD